MKLPLIRPRPPRLSEMADALRAIEASGVFSNGGPVARRFEAQAVERLFGGEGDCLAVANATLGLMMAIRHLTGDAGRGRHALMPAFTFAAAAHAALWAGLVPLLCDVDPDDWSAAQAEEERLLRLHAGRIAAIVPYATFGNIIDLDRYQWIARRHGVAVVIDAAASLGTIDAAGRGFGTGSGLPIIFSMHATKTFATAEGGLIYSADRELIAAMRRMTNFGFGTGRSAVMSGLNAKLPEVLALLALARLDDFAAVCDHRARLEAAYRARLDGFTLQRSHARRQSMQFMPLLLPAPLAPRRNAIVAALAERGIGAGHYFSPHLGEQPYFRESCAIEPTPVADAIGARILSLPITDAMRMEDVAEVCAALREACAERRTAPRAVPAAVAGPAVAQTLIVGGGPAGTALLTAATRQDKLPALVRAGLILVERGETIGGGRIGAYAITSDSTADTFLSAVRDNVHPEIAMLADHPAAREVARHAGAPGVPLEKTAPFLRATGERLGGLVEAHGGQVMTGHEALGARRTADGLWATRLRRVADGREFEALSRMIVIATGGHQPTARLAGERIAGASLIGHVGDRLVQSDDLLALGGLEALARRLADRPAPRIAILGGSTSALSAANLILKGSPALPLGAGGVTLLHRRALRPFYPSAEAARADGFTDFTEADICPVSGFVYRLAGFRLEARELLLRMLGIGGRAPDPRLVLQPVDDAHDPAALATLDCADVVIAALGYRPRALPLFDVGGHPIALLAHGPGRPPLVDRQCRVTAASGQPVPGAFGIGLAAGFVPHGALGGEPSFSGQANGLWLWQNDVGLLIVDQILADQRRAVA